MAFERASHHQLLRHDGWSVPETVEAWETSAGSPGYLVRIYWGFQQGAAIPKHEDEASLRYGLELVPKGEMLLREVVRVLRRLWAEV